MSNDILQLDLDIRGVARLTMNRPDVRNAFNTGLISAIRETMTSLNADPSVRVIILTGAGKAFSAGADLNMMQEVANFSFDENKQDAKGLAAMLLSIDQSPKPTIAMVNGPAMGGGVGLVAACNIAIAAHSAFFALSETKLGLIPAVISPFVLKAIGARQAERLFITGERFDADRACALNLVHEVAPNESLGNRVEDLTQEILKGGPIAQSEAKALIRAVAGEPMTTKLVDDTAERIARVRASQEGQYGIRAFLEKRTPDWSTQSDVQ